MLDTTNNYQENKYMITESESKTIDILKFILIVGVVFIHSKSNLDLVTPESANWLNWTKYVIASIFARSAVPGYFFISGILLFKKNRKWSDTLKKKIKTLLIPYFITITLWIAIFYIAQNISVLAPFFSHSDRIISQWGIFDFFDAYLGIKDGNPFLFPLWFIRDLFVLNLLSKIIEYLVTKFPKVTIIVLLIMYFFNLKTHLFFLATNSLFFFVLGCYAVKFDLHISNITKNTKKVIIGSYLLLAFFDCVTKGMSLHYIIHKLVLLIGVAFFIILAQKLNASSLQNKLLKLSKYSFFIFLFHEYNMRIYTKIAAAALPNNSVSQLIQFVGNVIVIITLCIILGFILKKLSPNTYNLITGSR